jgi:hypothetical protein
MREELILLCKKASLGDAFSLIFEHPRAPDHSAINRHDPPGRDSYMTVVSGHKCGAQTFGNGVSRSDFAGLT